MIDALINKSWALEARFHNVQASLMLKRLQGGTGTAGLSDAFRAEREKHQPYFVIPAAYQDDQEDNYAKPHAGVSRNFNTVPSKSGHVAVIPIIGTMTRYGGMCSYGSEDIASWIMEANAIDAVTAIVLEINSGGGEVDGTELLGAVVKQSKKPIVAYVTGMAASAAYWVASQCREIVMESPTTSDVGSIGVLAMHVDSSAFFEKEGHKVTIVRSEGSEDKALFNSVEPLDETILGTVKTELNLIRETFINTVKAGRPNISDTVFSGKMYPGKDAIKLGMADRVGYLGDAVYRADLLARKGA